MQVYRGMDIGTSKVPAVVRRRIPHHMIDLVDPSASYDVAAFQKAGREAIAGIRARSRRVLIVGGSGLHLRSLIDPMEPRPTDPAVRAELSTEPTQALVERLLAADPPAAGVVDLANRRRVLRAVEVFVLTGETPSARHGTEAARRYREYQSLEPVSLLGLDAGTETQERIRARTARMLADGLVAEVKSLRHRLGPTAKTAVGYREVLDHLTGAFSEKELPAAIGRSTLSLVKRQRTFFRRDPRISWLPWSADPTAVASVALEHWQ